MALYPTLNNSRLPNFPKPLDRKESSGKNTFPADLIADKRNYYTQIQFVEYSVTQQQGLQAFTSYAIPSSKESLKLPIPMKINDNYVLQWSAVSLTSMLGSLGMATAGAVGGPGGRAAASGVSLLAQVAGAGLGYAINPLMFMLFQRPEYRQFSLSWVLSPRNEKESKTIKNIITKCKQAAAPELAGGGFLMSYPQIAIVKMFPGDIFGHMVFKPCIITSVQANYTGAPVPSFHKNGAPTMVTLTLNLQEMQFWFRSEIT